MQSSFHCFTRLPAELQILIWEEAYHQSIPMPRVLESFSQRPGQSLERQLAREAALVDYSGDEDEHSDRETIGSPMQPDEEEGSVLTFPWAQKQAPAPPILHACSTSRQVALRLGPGDGDGGFSYILPDADHQELRPIWFDFSSDIVYLADFDGEAYQDMAPWSATTRTVNRTEIQHIAVNWALFHDGKFGRGVSIDDYRLSWIAGFRGLYEVLPAVTDLYLFIPAVRQQQDAYMAEANVHFQEPEACQGLPIALTEIPRVREAEVEIWLPRCACANSPLSWTATRREIEETLSADWLRQGMQEAFGDQWPLPNFPPRIHGRIFLRKGLTLEHLDSEKGDSILEIDTHILRLGSGKLDT